MQDTTDIKKMKVLSFRIPKKEPVEIVNNDGGVHSNSLVKTEVIDNKETVKEDKNQLCHKSTRTQPSAYDVRPASRIKPTTAPSCTRTSEPSVFGAKLVKDESVDFDQFVLMDPATSTPPRSETNCAPSTKYDSAIFVKTY
jgi:hypothetical protein